MNDAVFSLAANILFWVGLAALVALLIVPIVRQRFRKLRRCPKCWYDMSHTEGLRCPECGAEANRERQLHKSRRPRKMIAATLLLLVASHGVRVFPAVRERGWVAAVPTTVLIAALPHLRMIDDQQPSPLAMELQFRLTQDPCTLWLWQEDWAVEQCLHGDGERPPVSPAWYAHYGPVLGAAYEAQTLRLGASWPIPEVPWLPRAESLTQVRFKTRAIWPTDTAIYAECRVDTWAGPSKGHVVKWSEHRGRFRGSATSRVNQMRYPNPSIWWWYETSTLVGQSETPCDDPSADVRIWTSRWSKSEILREYTVDLPFDVKGTVGDILTPLENDDLDASLADAMTPRLTLSTRRLRLWTRSEIKSPTLPKGRFTLAFKVDILCGDTVLARGHAWYDVAPLIDDRITLGPLSNLQIRIAFLDPAIPTQDMCDDWQIRITGDAETALRNFECDTYWDGEIIMPLEIKIR